MENERKTRYAGGMGRSVSLLPVVTFFSGDPDETRFSPPDRSTQSSVQSILRSGGPMRDSLTGVGWKARTGPSAK